MNLPRAITTLLALVLALGFASQPLRAETSGNFTYTDLGTSIRIDGCVTAPSGAVVIPGTIVAKPVSVIQYHAFADCTSLTSVSIPASVTSIGDGAFFGCSSLTSVTFLGNAPTMSTQVFDYTVSGFTVNFDLNKTGFTAPTWNGHSSVGTGTTAPLTYKTNGPGVSVSDCISDATGTVAIPSSIYGKPVTSIGNISFYGCSKLTSVTIPSSVTSIGNSSFNGCTKLTSVVIPLSVTSLGTYVFNDCSSLTSVSLPAGITIIESGVFTSCFSLTSVTIPAGVTSIGSGAFFSTKLFNVTIPSSVTSIGEAAFAYTRLTGVIIPSSVTSLGKRAFSNCSNLTSATFLGNAPTVGSEVFDFAASAFTVYFNLSKTGFTEPTWNGYPSSGQAPTPMWRLQHFGINSNTGDAANNADPDLDGVVNLMELAFNLNPKQAGQAILTVDTGTTGLPLVHANGAPAAQVLSIQYLRRKAATNPGLTYTPQFSSDLGTTWQNAAGAETVESIDSEWERVTIPDTASGMAKRFGRVKVDTAP